MRILILISFLMASCSGYKFREQDNPLATYGVGSLTIPQFVNYSNIPGVADKLTKEFVFMFSQFRSLKLYSGEDPKADAILIGIVDGPKKIRDTFQTTQIKFTNNNLEESIGNRRQFTVPIGTQYTLNVNLFIIKNPTYEDIKMARSKLGKFYKGPKVIVNERMTFAGSLNLTAADADEAVAVNFTKNKAALNRSIEQTAKTFAINFREIVLNAF